MKKKYSKTWEHGQATYPSTMPETLVVKEPAAAHILQISNRAMWALGASGAIPFIKIGRSKRYDVADLRAYITEQKTGGAN